MIDTLAERVNGLTAETKLLRQETTALRDQLGTTRRRFWWVALVAVIALGLAGAVGITAWNSAQTDARVDAICPVLALVVGGADPSTRPEGPARDAYVRSIEVMRSAYVGTGCAQVAPLVPPRSTG